MHVLILAMAMAAEAGFDPPNGAHIFLHIPSRGDHASGSHPTNSDRLRAIKGAAAQGAY